jgi:hypothetical protein
MQDKEKLKKLIDIFEELLKIKGNEWLIDAILEKIKMVSTVEEIANHSVIQDIHEYCIEKVIIKQANDFYSDFKLEEISSKLVFDFVKMEHERRRDDFENFSLCTFQQIENITNYVFDRIILSEWENEKSKIAIQYFDKNKNQQVKKTVSEIVFGNAKDWFINVKFKALLYFFYFNKTIKTQIQFNQLVDSFNEIYQVRNLNHRGSSPTTYQEKILNKIRGNESKYYLKFYGFLEDFVKTINKNLKSFSITDERTIIIGDKQNTIGANNPALQELLNKMNEKK